MSNVEHFIHSRDNSFSISSEARYNATHIISKDTTVFLSGGLTYMCTAEGGCCIVIIKHYLFSDENYLMLITDKILYSSNLTNRLHPVNKAN